MHEQAAFSVATSLSSTIQLNDGVVMPLFGLGLFKTGEGEVTENAVSSALHAGYRLFDTAQFYANEADVARALRNSSVKREDVFVVSKVYTCNHGYDAATASVHETLSKMETDCIDMFLIHSPVGDKVVETYKALLDLKARGHVRSVGVSNFGIQHLEGLKAAELPPPSVNQIELHPFAKRPDIVKFCRDHNVAVMGFAPMARGQKDDDEDLISIAKSHQRTIAQVMIRWSVQKGFITIPKSSKQERIVANAQVFDFELTDEEMQTLDSKPDDFHVSWNPTTHPWVD